jgi:DNA-binding XRE family transcriptional regulator
MREIKFSDDCKLEDAKCVKQEIQFLNRDVNNLETKYKTLDERLAKILWLIERWDKRIELYRRLTEMQKEEALRLTEEELIIRFCREKLEMSYAKIGSLLGISKQTICNKLKLIEKKKQRKIELDQQKQQEYKRLYPMKKPRMYKKSIFKMIKNV